MAGILVKYQSTIIIQMSVQLNFRFISSTEIPQQFVQWFMSEESMSCRYEGTFWWSFYLPIFPHKTWIYQWNRFSDTFSSLANEGIEPLCTLVRGDAYVTTAPFSFDSWYPVRTWSLPWGKLYCYAWRGVFQIYSCINFIRHIIWIRVSICL